MNHISKIFLFLALIGNIAYAQLHDPVSWETSVKKINASEFELLISAEIEEGWHLYSQNVPDGGPIPTTILINEEKDQGFSFDGSTNSDGDTVLNAQVTIDF